MARIEDLVAWIFDQKLRWEMETAVADTELSDA